MKLRAPRWSRLFGTAIREFFERGLAHWGASAAFYTVFSLPPLLITVLSIAGIFLAPDQLEVRLLVDRISEFLTPAGTKIVEDVLNEVGGLNLSSAQAIPSALLLLVAGTAVFANFQAALNDIWGLERAGSPVRQVLRSRLISLLMIIAIGGLFFVSFALTTLTKTLSSLLIGTMLDGLGLIRILDVSLSGLLYWILFAAVYRILPDADIQWRDVALGSLITAALFLLGKELIASYLTRSEGASPYGAAGSVFGFLLFVYYSAQLFFLGAVFTRVWAESKGRVIGA